MIHTFSVCGAHFVLDVHSRALHRLDDIAYAALRTPGGIDAASPALQQQVQQLTDSGQLFCLENPSHRQHMQSRRPVIKALCLHMSQSCNLRCAYCFLHQHTAADADAHMSIDTARAALDFLAANSRGRRNLEVDFFGGEPMLNFAVIRELVQYGRMLEGKAAKQFRFTLTTNATLLDASDYDFINREMDNVVLSLDGREAIHDKMRAASGSIGSYASVVPKILDFLAARGEKSCYVRGTYTKHNLDFAQDVLHMADLGLRNISVEPVVGSGEHSLSEEDLPHITAQYENLAQEYVHRAQHGRAFNFFHFNIDLSGGPCAAKQLTGCAAGCEYFAVVPNGDLYPCHQMAYDKTLVLGNLAQGITNGNLAKAFTSCNVYTKPKCTDCWARYYCSGGCMATAFYANNSIFDPEPIGCVLQKKRIECALYVSAALKNI